ncbi:MAG: tetratricopeptide repeat protein [Bacteroidales bacterium]|nr:tetratricopeptide repeat protein [Bacteroidales bacterium]
MDKKVFSETKKRIHRYVAEHRLRDAFGYARSLSQGMMNWDLSRELSEAEENYRMMLSYASRGADDPGRSDMVATLGNTILELTDRLERENLAASEPTLYFNTLRYERMQSADSIGGLLDRYVKSLAHGSIFNVVSGGNSTGEGLIAMQEREALERRLFNRIWVTYPLSVSDEEALAMVFADESVPEYAKELFGWALALGGLQYFDSRRVGLLLGLYAGKKTRSSGVGLIGACLVLNAFPTRKLSRKVGLQLDALRDTADWTKDLRMVNMELVKTIDTDRITAKIRDEVVPGMMKLRPEIDKKLKQNIEDLDPSEMEENPVWQDMLHNSGLADKLKEMSEIQQEGGDVMMGTFSHLKSFPFFNEVANWFLPFHADYSAFSGGVTQADTREVADIIAAAPFLCDSDKYSFMLSLDHVPADQRKMMLQQFQMHGDQLAEISAAALTVAADDRRSVINKQIQNLFRFFRLFRRKGEMPNPFASGVNLAASGILASDLHDAEALSLIAEFYFSHGYYEQALNSFGLLGELTVPGAEVYQKMGYASQKLGDYAGAAGYYERAEMLDAGSDWTLRRLARCYMSLHRPEEALKRLRILERKKPESAAIALNIGRCLVELERYDEAVAAYFKSEYLDSGSTKALRPLAWCLLLTGDFAQSRKYYERVLSETTPTGDDYLNMGHLSLAEGKFQEAMNFYSLNISSRGAENATGSARQEAVDGFIKDMRDDARYLQRIGVDPELVPLLTDSILYNENL